MASTAGPQLPCVCVISLIQQNTCPVVATLQAAQELPSGPQWQGGAWGQGGHVPPPAFLTCALRSPLRGTDTLPGSLPIKNSS